MFSDVKVHRYECWNPSRLSSPTCEDLGIPWDDAFGFPQKTASHTALNMDRSRFGTISKSDPFSPLCIIPVPSTFGFDSVESGFIRKRNERERDRVRGVNDGYLRLKEHLPIENKEKRISKVETLRTAIEYIKYLQKLLDCSNSGHVLVKSGERDFHKDISESDSPQNTDVAPRKKIKLESEVKGYSDCSDTARTN